MIREYKTIQEIANPLMIVENVEGVTYDELGEIELPNGSVRRCKVLEIEGSRAVVQLFEAAQGACLWHGMAGLHVKKELGVRSALTGDVADALGPCLKEIVE